MFYLFILCIFYDFAHEQQLHKVLYFCYLVVSKSTHKGVPSTEYNSFVETNDLSLIFLNIKNKFEIANVPTEEQKYC